jgi:hypothetical protein
LASECDGEVELGEASRFFPSDAALAFLRKQVDADAQIVYSDAES